jgi:hypothetical protein
MTTSGEDVARLLPAQFAEARRGGAAAAAVTAMLIHKYQDEAGRLGISTQYDGLLSQVLQSKDAELIVCVAEELLAGKRLAQDTERARKFFSRADDLSSFMGSFVLGRILARHKKPEAIPYLKRARQAGHIPSAVLENHIVTERIPIIGWFLKHLVAVRLLVETWRALRSDQRQSRMWRYKDVFPDTSGAMAEVMAVDRGQPIPSLEALSNGASEQ